MNGQRKRIRIAIWAALTTLAGLAASANGAPMTLDSCTNPAAPNQFASTCSSASSGLTASAVSTTGRFGAIERADANFNSGSVGALNRRERNRAPHGAVDNAGHIDAILIDLGAMMSLDSITLGWWRNDSDLSVLAYTGSGAPNLLSLKVGQLGTNGWSLIGHYGDVGALPGMTVNVNDGDVLSRYWLISAYSASFGGTPLGNVQNRCRFVNSAGHRIKQCTPRIVTDRRSDYWQLAGVTASPPASSPQPSAPELDDDEFIEEEVVQSPIDPIVITQQVLPDQCAPGAQCSTVPEPGTLALLGACWAGGLMLRRRNRRD